MIVMPQSESRRELHERYLKGLPDRSSRRHLTDKLVSTAAVGCIVLVLIPLCSIVYEVVSRGAPAISWQFITGTPRSFFEKIDGGLGPSIQGTLIVVGLASLISVPVGILTGVYLSEFAGHGRFPSTLRLVNDILTGMPSIVIGLLGFLAVVLVMGTFSVIAGAFALSIIMTPIVVRVTEESLKLVPLTVREAGHALGVPKWKVSIFIILMAAKSGVLTGIVLGMARIAGETAPLIMTIAGARYFFIGPFDPMDALTLRIFQYSRSPSDAANQAGWGAAFILIVLVFIMSVALRFVVQRRGIGTSSRAL